MKRTAVGLAVGLALLTACGSKMDTDAIEADIQSGIEKQADLKGVSVDCPDDIKLRVGGEFHCIATADDGSTARVTVTMENDDGDVTWSVDS